MFVSTMILCLGLVLGGLNAVQAKKADGTDVYSMEVAPAKILVNSENHGGEVTVHVRNLDYSLVDTYTVNLTLGASYGITPYLTKADDNGDLVAKFRLGEVQELIVNFGGGATEVALQLAGFKTDGEEFMAQATVMVRY